MSKRVVIVGAGFAGLAVAKKLAHSDTRITLVDKTNHHLFQPFLYQVAIGALSGADIAVPVRHVLRKQKNVTVLMDRITRFDIEGKTVYSENGKLEYDWLVIAPGVNTCYYGNKGWKTFAPGVKTLSDALCIRNSILSAFEQAETAPNHEDIEKLLTFVVVGGGPTGVEIAGALAELAKTTMPGEFKHIDPRKSRIILLEALDRILTGFDPSLSTTAKEELERLGVEVRLGSKITCIDDSGVWTGTELTRAGNVIWAAGVEGISEIHTTGADLDRSGRVKVEKDCSIKNHPEVFVIGDAAYFVQANKPLPPLGSVAVQQGKFVAGIIKNEISPEKRRSFKYKDKGAIAVIGRTRAVLQAGKLKLSGFFAWLAWIVIHLAILEAPRNRARVTSEWIWYHLTNKYGIRLITSFRRCDTADWEYPD